MFRPHKTTKKLIKPSKINQNQNQNESESESEPESE